MSDVYVLIDASWSNEHDKSHILKTLNRYIDNCPYKTFTIYSFSRSLDLLLNRMCGTHIEDYDIGGATCLYDSIEDVCVHADMECMYPPRIVIWTDGIDTASTRCGKTDIEDALYEYSLRGWKFEFMNVNPFNFASPKCTLFRKITHYY